MRSSCVIPFVNSGPVEGALGVEGLGFRIWGLGGFGGQYGLRFWVSATLGPQVNLP